MNGPLVIVVEPRVDEAAVGAPLEDVVNDDASNHKGDVHRKVLVGLQDLSGLDTGDVKLAGGVQDESVDGGPLDHLDTAQSDVVVFGHELDTDSRGDGVLDGGQQGVPVGVNEVAAGIGDLGVGEGDGDGGVHGRSTWNVTMEDKKKEEKRQQNEEKEKKMR